MAPAQYPGCSGTRNLHDNLSDLRAQVAANQKVNLICRFVTVGLRHVKRRAFLMHLNYFRSKAPVLTARKSRDVVCATGCISRT